ncbi:MAG: insulinase family protein [Flavobacteriales bacterium]|nr:insulinase family protein [Flavobacteriales bacterium]
MKKENINKILKIGVIKKLVIISVIAISNSLTAQVDRSIMPESGPAPEISFGQPKTFSLDNGLTVIVVENNKLPRASAQLSFDNPLIYEGEIAGVNEVLGEMLGNGTSSIPKDKFINEVDYLGASLSVSGSGAFASSLSRYFDRILELMAGAILEPLLTQEEFDRQRDLIKENLKAADKDVATAANRVQSLLTYGSEHPSGEYVSQESLDRIALQDTKDFFNNYAKPNNAYLVIIGDVDYEKIKSKVTGLFNNWESGSVSSSDFPAPSNPDKTEIIFVDMPSSTQSVVSVMNTIDFSKKESDYFAALVANRILGGGGAGRLFNNLREDKGWTYGSYSGIAESYKTKGIVIAQAKVRNDVTDSSAVELLKELNIMKSDFVTDEELLSAKAKYTGTFVLSLESPSTIATFARNIKTQDLPEDYYNTFLANIEKVTKEDVKQAAQKYFMTNNTRVFVTGKGSEILKGLENIQYNGENLAVRYFDKFGNETERPDYSVDETLTAGSIIDNYIDAIGGLDKLNSVTSIEETYVADVMGNPFELYSLKSNKNQSLNTISVMGTSQKIVVNQSSGFMEVMGQKIEITGTELEEAISNAALFTETNLDYSTIELVGKTEVDDEAAYEIKVSDSKSLFYSIKTGLKLKEVTTQEVEGNSIITENFYNNYEEVEGILFPMSINLVTPAMPIPGGLFLNATSIMLNVETSDSDFE